MELSNKLLEFVVTEVAGADVVPLVFYLQNKKNVSEFKIAECIEKEINATRNMLYRLYNHNLASFIRKKDKEKGWYIYYWTFNTKNIKHLANKIYNNKIEKINERLEREHKNIFYICENECMRLDFDQSMNFQFKCPECGELLEETNNSSTIKTLEKKLKDIEKELKEVNKKHRPKTAKNSKLNIDFTAKAKTTTKKSTTKKGSKTTTKKSTTKEPKKSILGLSKIKKKEPKKEETTKKRGRKTKYNKTQDIFSRVDKLKMKE